MDILNLSGVQLDEYILRDLIGTGGMSAVYRAYQDELDRYVAVKVLSDRLAQEPGYIERFNQEAKTAAALEHPHIVPVYDFGTKDDLSFVVMRLLKGGTLKDRLYSGDPMRLGEVASLLEAISKALDHGHNRDIVHRDIKPANIMFDEQGTPYLVDFGIAKATQTDMSLTAENVVLGTPPYMAPEQWRADPLTPAVDQYALAVVAYNMVTGQLPFDGDTSHQIMYKHLNKTPPPPHEVNPNLPPALSEVIMRALSKDPTKRYPLVRNFSNAFKQAMQARADQVTPPADATVRNQPVTPPDAPATIKSQPPPPEPVPAVVSSPARQPIPRQQPPEKEGPGQRTLMNQVAAGGLIGLVMLFVVVVIAIIIIVGLILNTGGGDDASTDDVTQVEEVIDDETTDSDETDSTEGELDAVAPTPLPVLGDVDVIEIDTNGVRQMGVLYRNVTEPVRGIAYARNGLMASGHGDGTVRLWTEGEDSPPRVFTAHSDVVGTVDFNTDGSLLASGARDNTIIVRDTTSGEIVATLTDHTGAVRSIVFSQDGLLLASGAEDGTIRIWDTQTWTAVRMINADISRVLTVDFNPEASLLASGGTENIVKLWDVSNGTRRGSFTGHGESIRGVAFSPDGTQLASSSTDNSIRLWDVSTGNTLQVMSDHGRDVWLVRYHPDGVTLASGGRDNTLRLWDTTTGTNIATLSNHEGWVLGIDFSADGSQMLSGGGDGTVRLWDLE